MSCGKFRADALQYMKSGSQALIDRSVPFDRDIFSISYACGSEKQYDVLSTVLIRWFGELVDEHYLTGRRVGLFVLNEPITVLDQSVSYIELLDQTINGTQIPKFVRMTITPWYDNSALFASVCTEFGFRVRKVKDGPGWNIFIYDRTIRIMDRNELEPNQEEVEMVA